MPATRARPFSGSRRIHLRRTETDITLSAATYYFYRNAGDDNRLFGLPKALIFALKGR